MPIDATFVVLRGYMAQIARAQGKSIGDVSRFDLNKILVQNGYNRLTATETAPVISALTNGPYPTHGPGKLTQFSFEYWYNYFYKELPDGHRLRFALPVVNDDGTLRTEAQVPDKQALFAEMLRLGFRQFVAADHLSAVEIMAHAVRDADNRLQRQNIEILFRGDGRGWSRIRDDQGTKPQTRIDSLRLERNITKDWHPFNLQGNVVWVRNGEINRDNCLFSAVSVTPQFGVATKFPLLNDLMGSNPDAVGHALVSVRARKGPAAPSNLTAFEQARQRFAQPTQPDKIDQLSLPASQTNVYVVRMKGAYNTQLYQGDAGFPEYASDDLSWADHMVWLSVTRIHYDLADGNAGHQIIVNDHRWLEHGNVISAALLGPVSYARLRAFVQDVVSRGSRETCGFVYTPPGVDPPPFEIVKIREPFIKGRGDVKPLPQATLPPRPAVNPGRVTIPPAFQP